MSDGINDRPFVAYQVIGKATATSEGGKYTEEIRELDVKYGNDGKPRFYPKGQEKPLTPAYLSGYSPDGNVRNVVLGRGGSKQGHVHKGVIVFQNPESKFPEVRGNVLADVINRDWKSKSQVAASIENHGEISRVPALVRAESDFQKKMERAQHRSQAVSVPCEVCGRPLYSDESIARGRGPECMNK